VNGRQNKSAIKAARIIAKSESAPLGIHHLDDVLGIPEERIKSLRHRDNSLK
jgi:predicted transcriptional regulator